MFFFFFEGAFSYELSVDEFFSRFSFCDEGVDDGFFFLDDVFLRGFKSFFFFTRVLSFLMTFFFFDNRVCFFFFF